MSVRGDMDFPRALRSKCHHAGSDKLLGVEVDVIITRAVRTVDGATVAFDDVWPRREAATVATNVQVAIPHIDDLIATKRFAPRPKDHEDIRLLEVLRKSRLDE